MTIIIRFTVALIALFIWPVLFHLSIDGSAKFFMLLDVVSLSGLIGILVIATFKFKPLHGFLLVLLYVLALTQGFRLMLTLDQVTSLNGFFSTLLSVVSILFFIGARGYLRSEKGLAAFKIEKS